MSYYDIYLKYKDFSFGEFFRNVSGDDVLTAIESKKQEEKNFLTLLAPVAEDSLEYMARKSHALTLSNFGRTIQLYTPLYLSNYCENQCAYCGFNSQNNIIRRKLTLEEVEKEAAFISSTGLEHILVLTGDSREKSPLEYIQDCIKVLKKYFSSISLEIYALTESEYAQVIQEGADGLTIYQETYDRKVYDIVHRGGPKKDYLFRLNAPQRAAQNNMRNVNIGVLLGLNDWREEVFFMGLHAKYLQDNFPELELGVSIPRLRPQWGGFEATSKVTDKNMVQIIAALRIFLPRLGISLSTRESSELRDNLLPLGITRMSAGSSTKVGGHVAICDDGLNSSQFEISDTRDVAEIKAMLAAKGYQPVFKDWLHW